MMCVMKGFGLAALTLGMMAGAVGQAVGATIVNGDFEEATVDPGGFYVVLPGGSTAITGWAVTGVNVELVGGFWQASSGLHSIDLSGSAAGGIQQTFATTGGQSYTVTFDLAGDPSAQGGKSVNVSAGGQSQVFTFNTTGKTRENMGYTPMSFVFTAAKRLDDSRVLQPGGLLRGSGPGQCDRGRRPRAIDHRDERNRPGHAGPRLRAASPPLGRRLTTEAPHPCAGRYAVGAQTAMRPVTNSA